MLDPNDLRTLAKLHLAAAPEDHLVQLAYEAAVELAALRQENQNLRRALAAAEYARDMWVSVALEVPHAG